MTELIGVDPAAYRAALAARECPYARSPAEYAALGDVSTKAAAVEVVAALKPETYGGLSRVMDDMLNPFLDDPAAVPMLTAADVERTRQNKPTAAEEDLPMLALGFKWQRTLDGLIEPAIERMPDAEREALGALVGIRSLTVGYKQSLKDALYGGNSTAALTTMFLAHSMRGQLTGMGFDESQRRHIMRDSHGPLLNCTKLYSEQLESLSMANLGLTWDETFLFVVDIDLSKTRYDLFSLSPHGQFLTFHTRPKDMPGKNGAAVGTVTPQTPQGLIGCPIRLSPDQAERLWRRYIDSTDAAGLI